MYRLVRALAGPFRMLYAKLKPVAYARSIGVRMGRDVRIYGSSYYMFSAEPFLVTLGDNVHITQARFICHDGGVLPFRKQYPKLDYTARINVGSNVFIGLGACVLAGVTIGDDCVIGAYTVVTRDVPAGSVVAGNPGRVVRTTAEYLARQQARSLEIGDLTGFEKARAYRRIFHVDD